MGKTAKFIYICTRQESHLRKLFHFLCCLLNALPTTALMPCGATAAPWRPVAASPQNLQTEDPLQRQFHMHEMAADNRLRLHTADVTLHCVCCRANMYIHTHSMACSTISFCMQCAVQQHHSQLSQQFARRPMQTSGR